MYHQPSSSSSSSQGSLGPNGLTRYGSAPGSFLSTAVDSVLGPNRDFRSQQQPHHPQPQPLSRPRYFSAADTISVTSEPNKGPPASSSSSINNRLQRSYGSNEIPAGVGGFTTGINNLNLKSGGGGGDGSLVRHSSLPAGFLNHLTPTTTTAENGFSVTRGIGSYNSKGVSDSGQGISRLNSQLSFTRQDALSHISEENENDADEISTDNGHRKPVHSYTTANFGLGSWDDTNHIVFSAPPNKRTKNITDDVVRCVSSVESQFQFSLPQTTLELDKLLQIPQDSVACKIRAKRGCATHPRSIAERERRTRISGKLKKLQELVPNMDKQTSYADMLDLAVQHIKGLQNQVQKLNHELENCTCGCKQTK